MFETFPQSSHHNPFQVFPSNGQDLSQHPPSSLGQDD